MLKNKLKLYKGLKNFFYFNFMKTRTSKILKFLCSLVIWQMTASLVAARQWNPPIGIPTPEFGIEQVRPPDPPEWPSGPATTPGRKFVYVEPGHPKSTDSNNNYGYPDKPRKTIPAGGGWMLQGEAGLTLIVKGGIHPAGKLVTYHTETPTLQSPTMWFGYDGATIAGTLELGYHNTKYDKLQYFLIDGFKIEGKVDIKGKYTHHIAIRNCEITKQGTGLMTIVPANGYQIQHVVVYRNWIHDTGFVDSTKDVDYHGITISTYGRDAPTTIGDVWVLENTFHGVSGDATQINGHTGVGNEGCQRIYIGRNTAHHNRQSGFWSKQSRDCVISQNRVWGMTRNGPQPGNGLGYQYGPNNLWLLFNEIHDCAWGIRNSDTASTSSETYIIGNYIHDSNQKTEVVAWGSPEGSGIGFWTWDGIRYVIDNTIVRTQMGINELTVGNTTVWGNLISDLIPNKEYLRAVHGEYEFHYNFSLKNANNSPRTNLIAENMLMHGPGAARILYSGGERSLQYIKDQTDYGDSWIDEAPKMNGVLLTAPHTPIATNTEHAAYQKFEDLYGRSIRYSFDGRPRPAGPNRSVGATEVFTGTIDPPVIVSQPKDITEAAPYGELVVDATGNGPLSYQWFKDGVVINGMEWYKLPLNNLSADTHAGEYHCVVRDSFGETKTAPVNVLRGGATTMPPTKNLRIIK